MNYYHYAIWAIQQTLLVTLEVVYRFLWNFHGCDFDAALDHSSDPGIFSETFTTVGHG